MIRQNKKSMSGRMEEDHEESCNNCLGFCLGSLIGRNCGVCRETGRSALLLWYEQRLGLRLPESGVCVW